MSVRQTSLKTSILRRCVIFIAVLCVALSAANYTRYSKMLYAGYETYIGNILRYAASGIDTDDLRECVQTGVKSEKYQELQRFLDQIRENVNMHFLYIIIPLNTEEWDNVRNVMAAATSYEYQYEADELVELNSLTGDSYSPAAAKKYLDAYNAGTLSFFEEVSEWGDDYTGLLPLYDSAGEKVAALCMDVDILEIHAALREQIANSLFITLVLGGLFTYLFIVWTDARITRPIKRLETCVTEFARNSQKQRDPEALVLRVPPIRTGNEVESLSNAVERMSENLRDTVKDMISTEKELVKLNQIAHRDALTNVGNKAAYVRYVEALEAKLREGPVKFSILMADTNGLKAINDTYGHDKGDIYLQKCCDTLCGIYKHSPVFRIGGDEFVAVLTGQDYESRELLLKEAQETYRQAEAAENIAPWERMSVSLGLADYCGEDHGSVEAVFARADQRMYRAKQAAHKGRSMDAVKGTA